MEKNESIEQNYHDNWILLLYFPIQNHIRCIYAIDPFFGIITIEFSCVFHV